MKIIFLLLAFSIISVSSYPQKFSVAAERMNAFYVGIDNPVTIAVENIPCTAIFVTTDNGKISGSNGSYTILPVNIGTADIILYTKIHGRLKRIGESRFMVRSIPGPVAKVGPSSGGSINKTVLKAQQYIRADYEDIDLDPKIVIDSFSVFILRRGANRFDEIKNTGSKFNDEVVAALQTINTNDIVLFKDIYAMSPDGEITMLDTVIFTVF